MKRYNVLLKSFNESEKLEAIMKLKNIRLEAKEELFEAKTIIFQLKSFLYEIETMKQELSNLTSLVIPKSEITIKELEAQLSSKTQGLEKLKEKLKGPSLGEVSSMEPVVNSQIL